MKITSHAGTNYFHKLSLSLPPSLGKDVPCRTNCESSIAQTRAPANIQLPDSFAGAIERPSPPRAAAQSKAKKRRTPILSSRFLAASLSPAQWAQKSYRGGAAHAHIFDEQTFGQASREELNTFVRSWEQWFMFLRGGYATVYRENWARVAGIFKSDEWCKCIPTRSYWAFARKYWGEMKNCAKSAKVWLKYGIMKSLCIYIYIEFMSKSMQMHEFCRHMNSIWFEKYSIEFILIKGLIRSR